MSELLAVLESGFSTTETVFLPPQSPINPQDAWSIPSLALSVQEPGVVPRCSLSALHSVPNIPGPASPPTGPPFLPGESNHLSHHARPQMPCFSAALLSWELAPGVFAQVSHAGRVLGRARLSAGLSCSPTSKPSHFISSLGSAECGEHWGAPPPSQIPVRVRSRSEGAQPTVLGVAATWGRRFSASSESAEGAGLQAGCAAESR